MNVAVTGANGFIGLNLLKNLCSLDISIYALVRKGRTDVITGSVDENFKIHIAEVNYEDKESYERIFSICDIVIHLIGQMGEYAMADERFESVNIGLTNQILDSCIKCGVKQIIYCSTPGVLGINYKSANEHYQARPKDMYQQTKAKAEEIIIKGCAGTEMSYTIVRPDFVYGPGDYRRIKLYRNIKKRKFVLTTSGEAKLSPTYIDDVAKGIILTLSNESAYNEIFHISGDEVTSRDYLGTIAKETGVGLLHIDIGYRLSVWIIMLIENLCRICRIHPLATRSQIDFLSLNHSTSYEKAHRLLGYKPSVDLKEGIHRTIEWCRENDYV